jgi:hypothetical protein
MTKVIPEPRFSSDGLEKGQDGLQRLADLSVNRDRDGRFLPSHARQCRSASKRTFVLVIHQNAIARFVWIGKTSCVFCTTDTRCSDN